MKMAYYLFVARDLDPAKIVNAEQYNLIRNLYGRLVEYDANSQLIAGVPESFVTSEDAVTFTFGNKAKTIDGEVISANDAAISLKRLVMLGKSGHGDIRQFICPGKILNSPWDDCPGIVVKDNKLTLKVVKKHYLSLLLHALESADYSILPDSIINNNGSLKTTNHRNTSGPFYIDFKFDDGSVNLKANPSHYLYHQDMPQEIKVEDCKDLSEYPRLINGEIDLIPTTQIFDGADADHIINSGKYEIHETLPLKIMSIQFSERALTDFTDEQRRFAASVVGRAVIKIVPLIHGKPTSQFFQPTGEGSLNEDQLNQINHLREKIDRPRFQRQIELAPPDRLFKIYAQELKAYPEIKLISRKAPPLSLRPEERPDIYVITNDSSWTEDLNLLGHNFQVGNFAKTGFDSDKWFVDYIATEDRSVRLKKLNLLHFELLRAASMYPLQIAPYFAATHKLWSLNQLKTEAGIRLWLIRRN